MKFTLSWLKDHLKTKATVEEIATKLSAIGLEVESVDDPAREARRVPRRAHRRSQEASRTPTSCRSCRSRSRRASRCSRSCAARRTRAPASIGVFAPLGTYIPGSKITLEKKPVRGVVSNGMMCSAAELELSDGERRHHRACPPRWPSTVGERYIDAAGLNDPVFEVKLTPNRPDCTGVRGIARDLAAAGLGTLKPENAHLGRRRRARLPDRRSSSSSPRRRANACPVFAARCVKGVKNGPSPAWLQNRLQGRRPAPDQRARRRHELHQPGPRPAAARLRRRQAQGRRSARASARRARNSSGLDGKEHAVDETMCVIADDSGPLGLGGIIGGEASGSTEATTNVLIESA